MSQSSHNHPPLPLWPFLLTLSPAPGPQSPAEAADPLAVLTVAHTSFLSSSPASCLLDSSSSNPTRPAKPNPALLYYQQLVLYPAQDLGALHLLPCSTILNSEHAVNPNRQCCLYFSALAGAALSPPGVRPHLANRHASSVTESLSLGWLI